MRNSKLFSLLLLLSLIMAALVIPVAAKTPAAPAVDVVAQDDTVTQDVPIPDRAEQQQTNCALLDDPKTRGLMSAMFEAKLLITCGRQHELGGGAPPRPATPDAVLQTDVLVNDPSSDVGSSTTQSETSIRVNPNTGTICSAYNDSQHWAQGNVAFAGFSSSTDGGATFVDHGPFPPGGGGNAFGDPSLIWRRADGYFYFASLHSNGLGLWRSTDDCQSFSYYRMIHIGSGDDKELMEVDNNPASPYYGRMYVAWTDFDAGSRIYVTYSDDGITWSTPLAVSAVGADSHGAWPAVAPNGDVYVAWVRWTPYYTGPIDVEIVRSTNGGVSFSPVTNPLTGAVNPYDTTATTNCGRPALNGDIRYLPSPQIAVGPDGCLHVVYVYDPDGNGTGDVINAYYRRSCNNGATWGPEVQLNDDSTLTDQWFPTISVGPTNVVVATWYDRRLDSGGNFLFDYYKAISYDGGVTWEANVRVSDVSSSVPALNPNFDPVVATCYHGDYDQQVQDGPFVYIQWSDDRNIQNGHPDPDIWFEKELVGGFLDGIVYDSSTMTPIAGAEVEAVGGPTFNATSDLGGYYLMTVAVDIYDVTGSAFGYLPNTYPGVTVSSGATTTQDIYLDPAPYYTVDGTVTDLNTGWPLYASIQVPGYPDGPIWTDPETGYYSLSLPGGVSHDFHVEAWVPGYLPEDRTVGPLTGDETQDFALDIDPIACNAPGYMPVYSFYDDFESGLSNWVASGLWNLEDQGDTCGSTAAPFPDPNNAAYYGLDSTCTYSTGAQTSGELTLASAVSLPPAGGDLVFWSYEETECGGDCGFDNRYVEISNDNGATWDPLGEGDLEGDWYKSAYDLSAYGGDSVLIRFRFDSIDSIGNNYFGWLVDQVNIFVSCDPTAGGLVVGNVYDENILLGINDVEVSNEDGYTTFSQPTPDDPALADGFYTLFSPAGSKLFFATLAPYVPDTATVNVVQNDAVRQDFFMGAGWLQAIPDAMHVTLDWGQSISQTLILSNAGALDASFDILELDGGYSINQVSLPPSDGLFPQGPYAPSTGPAPIEPKPGGVPIAPLAHILGTRVYATEEVNHFHTRFDLDAPKVLPNLGTFDADGFPGAGEYVNGYVYVADTANNLYQLDPATGAVLSTKPITPPPGGETYTGLAVDPTSGDLYASSTSVGTSSLFIVNVDSGVSGLIGPITGSNCNIAIAIDGDGQMYGYDICTDDFWAIDKTTGAGTLIGSIGFDANFGQGMAWDPASGQMYMAAFNSSTFQGELRLVDPSTGNTALIDVLGDTHPGGLCQLPWLGMPIGVPWIWESPTSGSAGSMSDQMVEVTFDAGVPEITQPGHYYANLAIGSDTPYDPLAVPVTMTVLPPADMGKVTGVVWDNCTGETLNHVLVSIAGGAPIDQTQTDESGLYAAWLVSDTYDLAFSLNGYVTHTTSVDVVAGTTTTLDVNLVPDRPCVEAEPDRFEVWVLSDTLEYQHPSGLDITNNGDQDLPFHIFDLNGGYSPTLISVPASDGNYVRGEAAPSAGPVPIEAAPATETAPGDGPIAPLSYIPGTGVYATEQISSVHTLFDLDVPEVLPNLGPFAPADFPGAGEYLNGYVYVADGANNLYQLDPATGAVLSTIPITPPPGGEAYSGLALDPTSGVLYASSTSVSTSSLFSVDVDTGVATLIGPITGSTANIAIAIDGTGQLYGYDIVSDDFWAIDKTTGAGTVIGSIGFDANFGQGMGWDPVSGQMYMAAFNNGTFQAELRVVDLDTGNTALVGALGATTPGGLRQLPWLGIPIDAPWVWESPVDGTVPAYSVLGSNNVDIYFSARYPDMVTPMPLGTYTATLLISNTDPISGWQNVPVIMHIVDEYVTPTASFDSNSPVCLDGPMVFSNTTSGGPPPAASFLWDFGDGVTSTLESPTHLYGTMGTYTVTLEACNVENQCDSYSDGVEALPLPVAGFGYAVDELTVSFSNTSMYTNSHVWDFGDGVTSTLQNPVHTYAAEGSYTVTLQVTGDCGADELDAVAEVGVAPVAGFDSNAPVCLGETVAFSNTSTGTRPLDYLWSFGDGATSTETHPSHLYPAADAYTVTLDASNDFGSDQATGTVEVLPEPVAGFDYTPDRLAVTFANTSLYADSYLWDFGDGLTSTLENPAHTYAAEGSYTVTLESSGNCGSDTYSVGLTVTERFTVYLPIVIKND